MNRVFKSTAIAAVALSLALPALAENPMVGGAAMFENKNIIENALNSKDHTTLVAAVKAAGLVETLQGEGPFTVFAPTNEAFAALPEGTVDTLLKPENKEMLTKILTCHVVAADAMSDAIRGMIKDDGGTHPVKTVGGCTLQAKTDGDMITLTDERGTVANVTIADVKQSNGVIHVIDKVLLPAEKAAMSDTAATGDATASSDAMASTDMASNDAMASGDAMASAEMASGDNPMVGGAAMFANKNIVDNAVNSKDHTTLVAAVKAAGLVETLQSAGPFTVFAPTNAAFDKLPAGTVDTLLKPENKDMLTKILTAHVVAGKLTGAELMAKAKKSKDGFFNLETVSGDALSAQVKGNNLYIYDEKGDAAKVTIADVNQSNGVIHVVDTVLVPR